MEILGVSFHQLGADLLLLDDLVGSACFLLLLLDELEHRAHVERRDALGFQKLHGMKGLESILRRIVLAVHALEGEGRGAVGAGHAGLADRYRIGVQQRPVAGSDVEVQNDILGSLAVEGEGWGRESDQHGGRHDETIEMTHDLSPAVSEIPEWFS